MYVDNLLVVADALALTATGLGTGSIDLGNVTPKRDIGEGEPVGFGITIGVAADHTTGDETYEFDLVQATSADLGTSQDVLLQMVIAAASLTAGAMFFLPIPPGLVTKRYIGIKAILGGTTPTITFTASLMELDTFARLQKSYASGFTVS